ncbi:hypothetical protein O181_094554 [Austropuccinia psidii MF-1]|uniref:Integrase catalytic domain-containing protein n=1 Tax=Austropuccinia psidii MF-1 TaxID=1389203 RepID=A0A9Q3PAX7_9BASI|nr:hypothetical protein [Austropuccinia psidii MF-1]
MVKNLMENQHDQRIKKLISNLGGKFLNEQFKDLSSSCRFTHVFSPAYTLQHDGFAERENCTILDKAKCLLNGCGLPKRFWAEAVNTATLLSNLIPTPSRPNHSPYASWTGNSPRIKKLCIFGCQVVVLIQPSLRDWKLGESRYFLSFSIKPPIIHSTSGHEEGLVDEIQPSSDDHPPETQEEVDKVHPLESSSSDIGKGVVDEVHPLSSPGEEEERHAIVQPQLQVIGPRHPTLVSCDIAQSNILPYSRRAGALITAAGNVPRTYKMAINSLSKDLWINAIEKELKSMETLGVWEVVDLSPTFKLVGTTWFFKVKKDHLNSIFEHKARLCAQDIKSVFLNAPLAKTVYLSVPQGLGLDQRKVCLRLKKAIYVLKQALLAWYKHLKWWLVSIGFSSCTLDPCVFHRQSPLPLWLYIHVDDISIFGKDVHLFKTEISKEFQIKDIGPADLILGVKVTQSESFLSLDQHHFAESLLELYGMGDYRPFSTPLIPNHHLAASSKEDLSSFSALKISYRSIISSLNYLSTATRPDLSYAISMLSQFL